MWKVVTSLAVFAIFAGCAPPAPPEGGETVALVLPTGDPTEGRRTFQALGCTLCHTVTGEDHLPVPSSLDAGPELGLGQSQMTTAELMSAILASSHISEPVVLGEGADGPTMVDYAETLSIRQLVDVTAYLKYIAE